MSMAFGSIAEEHEFMNRMADLAHEPDTHDCPEAFFCEDDPHCSYAQCDGCGAPNQHCHCDRDYERFRDK